MKHHPLAIAILATLAAVPALAQESQTAPTTRPDGSGGETLEPVATVDISRGGVGSRMWLGDLTGDGRYEIVMAQPDGGFNDAYFPHSVQALTAFNLDGDVLWQVGKPTDDAGSGSDIPCQLYDLDDDGNLDVIVAQEDEIRVYNGQTGELKTSFPVPNEHAHDAILIADLAGDGHPSEIVLKDRYRQVWAMSETGDTLWTFQGNVGHYGWPYDLDGDGRDELIFGYHVLSPDGEQLWEMDLEGHADAIWVADVQPDHEGVEILVGGDGSYLYDARGNQLWAYENTVESQNAFPGDFRSDLPGLEIGGLDRIDRGDPGLDGLFLIDANANELYKEERPVPGWSSIATVVRNFESSAGDLFLAYRRGGGLEPGLYDGRMARRYAFPASLEWAHFMYGDLVGNGRSQIIGYTLEPDADGKHLAHVFAADGAVDLAPSGQPRQQPKRLYNWTRYWGSETPVE